MSVAWWLRQARSLADPAGATAGRLMLERDAAVRAARLRAAALDRARQRVRPSRPRMRALMLKPDPAASAIARKTSARVRTCR